MSANTDDSIPKLLHIGTVNLSSGNVTTERRREFRAAFQQAISIAIENNVDAVVQTGLLWATRSPADADVRTLRSELERLQQSGIRFIHAGGERDTDMDIVDDLVSQGLIDRPYDTPVMVGSAAVLSIRPGESRRIFNDVQQLVEADAEHRIIAAPVTTNPPDTDHADFDLDRLPESVHSQIDRLLLGYKLTRNSMQYEQEEGPDVYVGGPTELNWRKNREPEYPCDVGIISSDDYESIELKRDPFVIYIAECTADTKLEDVTNELEPNGRTAFVRLQGVHDDNSFSEEELSDWLNSRSEISSIKDRRTNYDTTPQSERTTEFEVTTKYQYQKETTDDDSPMFPDDISEIAKVETYVCGQNDGQNESTCQECFTRQLFGLPEYQDVRDTEPGDLLLLYDYGNQNIQGTDDKYVYGPFRAETEMQPDIEPEAWDGEFRNQVDVSWEQLYRLPADESPVDMWDDFIIEGQDARDLLEALRDKGTKIRVTENGERKPIEEVDDEEEDEEEEEDDEGDDPDDEDDPNDPEGLRDIVELRDIANPLPRESEVAKDPNPGAALIRPAVSGEDRPGIYERALIHLIAGKNVVFYGPPGSGKTRIAERLSEVLCSDLHISTANAEWTNQEVVGGYKPQADGFTPSAGVLTRAAAGCAKSLRELETPHPQWLLIDELNRANLDEAFGEILTLLDLSYRTTTPLEFADDETQYMPLAFRILGTMNSEDQAQLFALGYAFRRRFAFIHVPPLYDQPSYDRTVSSDSIDLDGEMQRIQSTLERATISGFEYEPDLTNDSALAIPYLESVLELREDPEEKLRETFREAQENVTPQNSEITFDEAIRGFVQELSDNEITQIGQGIMIDAYTYVLMRYLLFPADTGWEAVDNAVAAYILPQIESYTTNLRRADTVAGNSETVAAFDEIISFADSVGFARTASQLREAKESNKILG